ncbi:MAG: O-antigen ligase family protein [Bacteroidales bacterium]|nr:O-antigen ligase family protein [Bacteroidales bacterium]
MIALFVKVFPYLLLFYFLYRSIKEPIFFLGIPFLMFLGSSIFFEKVSIFSKFGRMIGIIDNSDLLLLAWLIIFWIISRNWHLIRPIRIKNDLFKQSLFNSMDYIIISLMIISSIGLIVVYREYENVENVFSDFVTLFSLFLGYFIIKDVIRRFGYSEIEKFLFAIIIVNSIASILYILHQGLHFTIYTGEEYATELFQGEEITRTFWFMPVLCFFSISFLFVFKRTKPIIFYPLLSLNILALFISYTRSFLVIVVILIILYYILDGYKNRNVSKLTKNIIIASITGLFFLIMTSNFFPTSTDYFLSRFTEVKENPTDESSNSIIYRFGKTSEILDKIDNDKLLIGFGPVTEAQLTWVEAMRKTTYDLVWTGVVFRWGYIGLVLFVLLYLISIVKAFNLFMKGERELSLLSLLFLLMIISQLIESFVSSTFLADNRIAMGLWYLAMLSGLIEISAKNEKLTELELDNEKL